MDEKLRQLKKDILVSSFNAGACHIGSALSCIDILYDIFYRLIEKDDIFIFGKASGVSALYVILADKGYFPKEKLADYLKKYPLASKEVNGVIHSVGSCGHGLNVAAGIALGKKMKQENGKVYCLIGDGECQEGSVYEAILFARHHNLDNLHLYVDNNGLQALGKTSEIIGLHSAFTFMKNALPNVKIIKTIKGQGVSFLENKIESHYMNLTKELLNKALCEI